MLYQLIVRESPVGQFTAHVMGLPEIRTVAATEEEAIARARTALAEWVKSARWVLIDLPVPARQRSVIDSSTAVDSNDPMEHEYLRELEQMRAEDRERTLRELDRECSNSSSTPIT